MELTRVVINGASGRMGQEIIKAVVREPWLKVVGAVEKEVAQRYFPLAETPELVPFSSDLDWLLRNCNADVVVDFTNAEASITAARIAIKQKVNMVIGTTGLSQEDLAEIEQLCQANGVGAVVAPNFSLGAALLIHLARFAAKFFEHAEIIEMHHDKKADAPSGTAMATAKVMSQAHGKPFIYPEVKREILSSARGGQTDGIAIHSVRLPGFMAGQEVIFSGPGETLSLAHNAINRECYLPGVVLAIKEVTKRKGLTYGLGALLEL
ncbi:MAG: 4-hydroxy-tetrahydrodipicolinate reductase [Dehalococcoidia bacterium]